MDRRRLSFVLESPDADRSADLAHAVPVAGAQAAAAAAELVRLCVRGFRGSRLSLSRCDQSAHCGMKKAARRARTPLLEVRYSPIHGYGVFARRQIRKGTTILEYLGDRLSHSQADARYEHKESRDNHTFLFTVDSKTVIED